MELFIVFVLLRCVVFSFAGSFFFIRCSFLSFYFNVSVSMDVASIHSWKVHSHKIVINTNLKCILLFYTGVILSPKRKRRKKRITFLLCFSFFRAVFVTFDRLFSVHLPSNSDQIIRSSHNVQMINFNFIICFVVSLSVLFSSNLNCKVTTFYSFNLVCLLLDIIQIEASSLNRVWVIFDCY